MAKPKRLVCVSPGLGSRTRTRTGESQLATLAGAWVQLERHQGASRHACKGIRSSLAGGALLLGRSRLAADQDGRAVGTGANRGRGRTFCHGRPGARGGGMGSWWVPTLRAAGRDNRARWRGDVRLRDQLLDELPGILVWKSLNDASRRCFGIVLPVGRREGVELGVC